MTAFSSLSQRRLPQRVHFKSQALFTDQTDINTSNNSVTQSSPVSEQTDLGISITGPATASPGASLQYIVSVTNSGPSPATAVHASYQAPAGMILGTFNAATGICFKPNAETIACDFASLNPGATVSLSIAASIESAGAYQATATVMGAGSDGASANNSAVHSTTVSASPPSGGGDNGGGGGSGGGGKGGSSGGGGALSPLFLLSLAALWLSLRVFRRVLWP